MPAEVSYTPNGGIKLYHGYGQSGRLVIYGHAFRHPVMPYFPGYNHPLRNIGQLLRLFRVKPLPAARVRLLTGDRQLETLTENDGFFRFEWNQETIPGQLQVAAQLLDQENTIRATAKGSIYVPGTGRFAVISDIDDTVMVSHSATVFRRLRELVFRNPEHRRSFSDVTAHYRALAHTQTDGSALNPFFYVSSSEWNLYEYLKVFFRHHGLPEGVFLLSQLKRWFELLRSGQTGHHSKLLRMLRIFETFPEQRFVLLGDNSQQDPGIYAALAEKYKDRILAIYIRNVRRERFTAARQLLNAAALSGIPVCIYRQSSEAMRHSRETGLLE